MGSIVIGTLYGLLHNCYKGGVTEDGWWDSTKGGAGGGTLGEGGRESSVWEGKTLYETLGRCYVLRMTPIAICTYIHAYVHVQYGVGVSTD